MNIVHFIIQKHILKKYLTIKKRWNLRTLFINESPDLAKHVDEWVCVQCIWKSKVIISPIAHYVHCWNVFNIQPIMSCEFIISQVRNVIIPYTSQCHMLLCSEKPRMYSSKVIYVLDWILWLCQDLIVYSEVLWFQVTLALMGSL